MTPGRLSLAQQLAQLDQPAPVDFDPEELTTLERGSDDEGHVASSAAREHYFEVGPSSLRKLHDSLTDPKYDGVKTSRKKLTEASDDVNEEDEYKAEDEELHVGERDEEGTGDSEAFNDEELEDERDSSSDEESDEEGDNEEEDEEEQTEHIPPSKRKVTEDMSQTDNLKVTLQKTREDDLRKGKAVMRQMSIWDSLLDARIRLQKTVTVANQIASPASWEILGSAECQEDLQKYLEQSILLTEDLFELQETLLGMNEVATPPPRKRRRIQGSDNVESVGAYLNEASSSATKLEQVSHLWLVQTLTKWSAKIQAVAPSVLLPSSRNAFTKNSQHVKSAVQLVDETLLDYTRLLGRTRTLRGKAKGEADDKEEDPEVFDDTDFYQQLLRDVIESRGDGGAYDWMALQREKKAKKKVETRASKGRKLRYETHEKLQNFMVPVPAVGAWHEEQIDELFASLLGKGFEGLLENEGDGVRSSEPQEVVEAVRGGFRVFG